MKIRRALVLSMLGILGLSYADGSSSQEGNSAVQVLNQISGQISQVLAQQQQSSQQAQGYQQATLQLMYPVTPFPGWQDSMSQNNGNFGIAPLGNNAFLQSNIVNFLSGPDQSKVAQMASGLIQNSGSQSNNSNAVSNLLLQYGALDVGSMSGVQAERANFKLLLLNAQIGYMNYVAQQNTQVLLNNILMAQSLLLASSNKGSK